MIDLFLLLPTILLLRVNKEPNTEHCKVFGDKSPMIGWRKPKSLKDHLVSAKIKREPSSDNRIAPCRSRYQICSFIEETKIFQNKDKSETFGIRKGILNCSTNLVVYLIEFRSCSKQYVPKRKLYTFCIQKLYKMYTTDVSKMYTKCMPHFDKLLHTFHIQNYAS